MQNLPKIYGLTPGQTGPFLCSKIGPKRPIFYLIAYMTEFLYAGKNTEEELRNAKSNQISVGNPWPD